jgi:hypothetical protein
MYEELQRPSQFGFKNKMHHNTAEGVGRGIKKE